MANSMATASTLIKKDGPAVKYVLPFLAGGMGGMAPILSRVATDLAQHGKKIFEVLDSSIILGMSLYAVMGGIIVFLWGERNLQRAFYLGIGLPSLLAVAASNATTQHSLLKSDSLFESVVEARSQANFPDRHIAVYISSPEADVGNRLHLIFQLAASGESDYEGKVGELLSVPADATTVQVITNAAESKWISLPNITGVSIILTMNPEKQPLYGFYYALGANMKPYVLALKSRIFRSFKLDNVEISSSCSVITLKNVTSSAAVLFGIHLKDGHLFDLTLRSTTVINSGNLADVYIGTSCVYPSGNEFKEIIVVNEPPTVNPLGGVITLLDSSGEIDSRKYGKQI